PSIARGAERADVENATLDAQARLGLAAPVEIAMETRGLVPLAPRAVGEAPDVVMAIALDMRDAEGAHGRQILLERHHGQVGQVLRAHEEGGLGLASPVQPLDQRAVQEGLEDALAVLAADAAVAERHGQLERFHL